MAIRDVLTTFGEAFDIGQVAGTYLLTNQVDLGVAGRDPGNGQPVYLNIVVTEAVTDAASASLVQFRVASDDSAAIHATTSTGHVLSPPLPKTALTIGKTYSFALPAEGSVYERYLGVQAIVSGETTTAGAVTAWLSPDPVQGWKAYADAVN